MRLDSSIRALCAVSRTMENFLRVPALLALFLAACASSLSEDGRPCPCSSGWTCCEARNVCVSDAQLCTSLPDSGPAAPSLRASSPASPTNAAAVDVLGVSEARTTVELFTNESCTPPATAKGPVDAAGQFRIRVPLAANAANRIWAHAVSVSGTVSQCVQYPLEIVQDSVAPEAPVLARLEPGPISNLVTRPELSGAAEIGSTVVLYAGGDCAEELAFSGPVDVSGTFHVEARVERNTSTVFAARAFDAAGNGSACSAQSFRFEHDDVPPAAPAFAGTTPPSPGRSATPVIAAVAEPQASVKLFASEGCAGEAIETRAAAGDGTVSFQEPVVHNAANPFSTIAIDAAGNVSPCSATLRYVHDDIPPPAPPMASFLPVSPAQTLQPTLFGAVPQPEPGEKLHIVRGLVYPTVEVAVIDLAADGFYRLPVDVDANIWTSFFASTLDLAGNESEQVYIGEFVNDTLPPRPPSVASTSIPSPASADRYFQVVGTGTDSGDRIDFWTDPGCTVPFASGGLRWAYASGVSSFHATLLIDEGAATDLYATETDGAGNRSGCSADHVSFANQPGGPAWGPATAAPFRIPEAVMTATGSVSCFGAWPSGTTTLAVESAPAGGTFNSQTIATVPDNRSLSPDALVAEGDQVLALWGLSGDVPGELHFAVRSADGTWSADQVLSTHAAPISWIWQLAVVPDRAGGAWAAWVVWDTQTGAGQELWASHHDGSVWTPPVRVSSGSEFFSLQIAGGASGYAALAWDLANGPDEGQYLAFFDPSSGWSAREPRDTAGSGMPIAVDDSGRTTVVGFKEVFDTVLSHSELSTLVRHPDGTWDAPVVHETVVSYLSQVRLQITGAGDAVLAWDGQFGGSGPQYLYAQRFDSTSGWGAVDFLGTVKSWQAMSLTADGSLWMLITGPTPHLQLIDGTPSEPSWLLRHEPGTGWLQPQLVIDDPAACYPGSWCNAATVSLLRNDAGTVLLPWRVSGADGIRSQLRWYR